MIVYALTFILFAVGLYGLLVKRNLVKMIISLAVMKYAVNLFFILIGYRSGGTAPLAHGGKSQALMVNPLPQVMTLTALMIGLALIIVMVTLALRVYEKYGTFDIHQIRRLRG